jgi:TolA-binding protein
MRTAECRSDLVVRARRHRLSAADQSRLHEHLASCASCRFDIQIGGDFDQVAGLRPGYEVRDAHLADVVLGKLQPPSVRVRLRGSRWAWSAVATLLVAATAVAGIILHRTSPVPLQGPIASAPSMQSKQMEETPRVPPGVLSSSLAPSDSSAASLEIPVRSMAPPLSRRAASPRPGLPAPAEEPTAASLFERATLERQHRHASAAITLYRQLQRLYPNSNEARVSHVSLGRLLVDSAEPAAAIAQFDAYLTTPGDGLLAPEALFGKARALEAIGRTGEGRATWQRLLTSFADSVYASEARRHLQIAQ